MDRLAIIVSESAEPKSFPIHCSQIRMLRIKNVEAQGDQILSPFSINKPRAKEVLILREPKIAGSIEGMQEAGVPLGYAPRRFVSTPRPCVAPPCKWGIQPSLDKSKSQAYFRWVHDLQDDGLLDRYAGCDFYHDFVSFFTPSNILFCDYNC
jgi:hypothetical protein